ncbi:MAG: STAS domain-containing protein [Bacteroidetes bacterium]|jgi:anti-anti-sigma factor|nr:STAS domain-containing protein [Bacteroidota bacterium]
MLEVQHPRPDTVVISGRFDASQVDAVRLVLDQCAGTVTIDFGGLEYISSAGLGVLVATQRRLKEAGGEVILRNLSGYVRDIFKIARFDLIFTIQ